MTRREFFSIAVAAGAAQTVTRVPLIVPVQLVLDGRVQWSPEPVQHFWSRIWPQAVRDFERCGIRLQSSLRAGDVCRPPGGEPVVTGLERGVVNLVITDRIPMEWDGGRALSGFATSYRGYHMCMVALEHAHCHQIPFLSVNTCVHELLHAVLHDIFEGRPMGLLGEGREFRIDWYATRLWLFHDGGTIRKSAQAYVERLRSGSPPRT
ncbi:MAG TPA: hypothetical protein VE959_31160 [Bryobacteraceae bacterium]|nr:hypothetical protein [Bryobacteraceae bacterium]